MSTKHNSVTLCFIVFYLNDFLFNLGPEVELESATG